MDIQPNNTIIAYIDDKAIIEDDYGTLFFCIMPEEFVNIGETMFANDLTPVSELPIAEQYYITQRLRG